MCPPPNTLTRRKWRITTKTLMPTMRIQVLQHDDKEWIGNMEPWFNARDYSVRTCLIYKNQPLPDAEDFDWLVIMGGGMSVNDEENFPWLIKEKLLIEEAVAFGKKVLGICLGGQLIASAMGAPVYPSAEQEIGWHRVHKTSDIASWLPHQCYPLSWHGECFDLPAGAISIASSEITPHQGFCLGPKVWGLQFHLEATLQSVHDFYQLGENKPVEGTYVQSFEHMIAHGDDQSTRDIMYGLLDALDEA